MSNDPQFDAIIGRIAEEFICNLHGAVVPTHGLRDCPPQTRDSIDPSAWHTYFKGSELCAEQACLHNASHFVGDCSNPHFQCYDSRHIGAGRHTMADCKQFKYTGPGSIGYVHGQIHPETKTVNLRPSEMPCDLPANYRYKANCDMKGDHNGPCAQTSPELVHIPGHYKAKSHSICDNPACPMRYKHHMEQPCLNFVEVKDDLTELPEVDDYVSDEISTPGLLMRNLGGILTIMRHPIAHGDHLIEGAISALALLPMILGVLNGFVALGCAVKVGTTLAESSVPQPFVDLAVLTAYVSVCMLAISHSTKNLSITSGYYTDADGSTYASSRFTQYIGRIQTGTALALVSVFVEAAAFMFYKI